MYSFEIREHLDTIFQKIGKKNPKQLEIIHKKIEEVIQNPQHYKMSEFSTSLGLVASFTGITFIVFRKF